jgi:hypothetical protein
LQGVFDVKLKYRLLTSCDAYLRILAQHAIYDKLSTHPCSKRTMVMDEPTIANVEVTEADLLVERNVEILDQVRKGLSQEYLRIMSSALHMGRLQAAEDAAELSSTKKSK